MIKFVLFLLLRACIIVLSCWLPKPQLWRLEVASQEDWNPWSEQRSDEGEMVAARPRQLDGLGAIRSQTGGTTVATKDYISLSFSV